MARSGVHTNETHITRFDNQSQERQRLHEAHEQEVRTESHQSAPGKGTLSAVRLGFPLLPDAERLRRASLFQRTYAGRKSISSPLLTLYVLPRQPRSNPKLPLVGFVVGKKVHNRAVRRNLLKRRVREAYRAAREQAPGIKQWYSMVWVINSAALEATWDQIRDSVCELMEQANSKFGKQRFEDRVNGEPVKGA